jgi:hypothetical protein
MYVFVVTSDRHQMGGRRMQTTHPGRRHVPEYYINADDHPRSLVGTQHRTHPDDVPVLSQCFAIGFGFH